ncbi:MAG: HAD family hydrolase [Candidatus Latescibacterota bacterium]|jgi:putative hydrolase of the HAD superfamily
MPGAKETLSALRVRGLKTAIITNGGTRTQNTKIDLLGLRDLVDAVVISEAAGIKKPAARIFAMALEQVEVEASAAVFVGDHPNNDVLGAQRAGLTAVWMRDYHTWPQNESEPQWQVDRLIDILDLEL